MFQIEVECGLQPYKEKMHSKGSGNMKMSEEEIKKYTEAISKNSDNLFVCPRPVGPWQAPKGGLGHNSPQTLHGTTVQPLKVTGVFCSIFLDSNAGSFLTPLEH